MHAFQLLRDHNVRETPRQVRADFAQLLEHTVNEATVATATLAIHQQLMSTLIIALRQGGADLGALSILFFDGASAAAEALEGDQRIVFMHEAKVWSDLLNASTSTNPMPEAGV